MPTELATCCGCFVQNDFDSPFRVPKFQSSYAPPPVTLTEQEKEILGHLSKAWNAFVELDKKHPDDNDEFRRAIHDAQKMIALRVARRVDQDVWFQPG
jgi:hypothetical protein